MKQMLFIVLSLATLSLLAQDTEYTGNGFSTLLGPNPITFSALHEAHNGNVWEIEPVGVKVTHSADRADRFILTNISLPKGTPGRQLVLEDVDYREVRDILLIHELDDVHQGLRVRADYRNGVEENRIEFQIWEKNGEQLNLLTTEVIKIPVLFNVHY